MCLSKQEGDRATSSFDLHSPSWQLWDISCCSAPDHPSSRGRSRHPSHLHASAGVSSLMSYQTPARLHPAAPVSFASVFLLTRLHATHNLSCICNRWSRVAVRDITLPPVCLCWQMSRSCHALMEIRARSGGGIVSPRCVEVTAWNILQAEDEKWGGGQTGRLPRYIGRIGDLSKPVALRLTGATLWLSEERAMDLMFQQDKINCRSHSRICKFNWPVRVGLTNS